MILLNLFVNHPLHHYLTHNAFKPVEKQQKTIEEMLFHVLNIIVTKKTQVVSSNLFVLTRKISL